MNEFSRSHHPGESTADVQHPWLEEFLAQGSSPAASDRASRVPGSLAQKLAELASERTKVEANLSPDQKRELRELRLAASSALTEEERQAHRKSIEALDPAVKSVNERIRKVLGEAELRSFFDTGEAPRLPPLRMSTIECHRPADRSADRHLLPHAATDEVQRLKSENDSWYAPHGQIVDEAQRRGVSVEFARDAREVSPRLYIFVAGEKKYLPIEINDPVGPQLDRLIESKVNALEPKFNVRFSRLNEPIVKQPDDYGSDKWIRKPELKARQPSLSELCGVESGLEQSTSSLRGPTVKVAFLSEKVDTSFRPAGQYWSTLKGSPTCLLFGDREHSPAKINARDYVYEQSHARKVTIHEFAHHYQHESHFWNKDGLLAAMGWRRSQGPSAEWMLQGKEGEFYKIVPGEVGTSRQWHRCNEKGEPTGLDGKVVSAGKELVISQYEVGNKLLVQPVSSYFDNAAEMHAEGLTSYRGGAESRARLLQTSPTFYAALKQDDQQDVDLYYREKFGESRRGLRMPDGRLADRNAENESLVADFETLMKTRPDVEPRLYPPLRMLYSLQHNSRSTDVAEDWKKLFGSIDEMAADMQLLVKQQEAFKKYDSGSRSPAPEQDSPTDRYERLKADSATAYAVHLIAKGQPEEAKEYVKRAAAAEKAEDLLVRTPMSDSDFAQFGKLTSLNDLELSGQTISASKAETIANLARLQHVRLRDVEVDDKVVSTVLKLPALNRLSLDYVRGLTDAGLSDLKFANALKTLRLNFARTELTADALKSIHQCPNLDQLILTDVPQPDVALANLHGHPGLSQLSLDSAALTDSCLAHIGSFPKLSQLSLFGPVGADGYRNLQGAKNLDHLVVFSKTPSGDGLASLKLLPRLKDMQLDGAFDDASLAGLQGCAKLEWLHVKSKEIKGDSLSAFERIPNLRSLSLYDTQITEDKLDLLKGCGQLRSLSISTSNKISQQKIEELRKALPKCSINIEGEERNLGP